MYVESRVLRSSGRLPVLVRAMEVVDDEHIGAVVEVIRRSASATLRTPNGAFDVRPVRDSCQGHALALESDELDLEQLEIDSLEVWLGDASFAIDADALQVSDGVLRIERPGRVYSSGRWGVELGADAVYLRVDWDGMAVGMPVVEFAVDELVVVGLSVDNLDLRRHFATLLIVEQGGPAEISCEVTFGGFGNLNETRLLVHSSVDQRSALVDAYTRMRFPRLVARGALAGDAVIDLFRRSGYLDLREVENLPSESWCRPEFAEGLSIDRVYEAEDGALLGHVSVTRAYSRTWLGHQLSTVKGHGESAACRVALYNLFASVPTSVDGRDDVYLLGYYDRSLRWHQLFFEAFVDWIGDERLVSVTPFDRFEPLELDASANHPEAGEFVIEPATDADIPVAVAMIRSQMPELAVVAFDIDEQRLFAEFLHHEYARAGVERGRRVLVARERGEVVGVALCETGSAELSLFNLFNLAQVYNHDGISRAAHVGLYRAVCSFYAGRGIKDPVIVSPPRRFRDPDDAGLRLDETMGCIIWAGETLEQYQTYVRYCFEKIGAAALTKAS